MSDEMKIGLSLGGGGARGLGHIVVLEVLDELGIKVDAISGSSMGALLGMGYASGMSGKELRSYALETFADRAHVISQLWALRPAGIENWLNPKTYTLGQIDPQKVLSLFTPVDSLPERLEDLSTPLTVVTTDYYGWKEAVFSKGNLNEIVAASISIPMIFKPVRVDGRVMIDGNISNPLPFDCLPDDMDRIIAVDVVGGPNPSGTEIPSGFDCSLGANQIMMQAITNEKLETEAAPDILIRPPINEFRVMDFLKTSTILRVCDGMRDDVKRQISDMLDA
ncbi:MAG: patatin-like phospholipase family protein [Hyphomicrobiales bacterium]